MTVRSSLAGAGSSYVVGGSVEGVQGIGARSVVGLGSVGVGAVETVVPGDATGCSAGVGPDPAGLIPGGGALALMIAVEKLMSGLAADGNGEIAGLVPELVEICAAVLRLGAVLVVMMLVFETRLASPR